MIDNGVVINDLVKRYGNITALGGVSFAAKAGQIFGLLGPNGAGKTTALECMVGLRKADSGTVEICGVDVQASPRKVKELIGVQLQATALQDRLTPREALKLFASFYREAEEVESLLARFFLQERADAAFETLSGGERQRLALALAMVNRPRVVVLDEPTSGLDAQSRRQLHGVIRQMRDEGKTVVMSTHYIQEAQELCDVVAMIDRGKIVRTGTPAELIAGAGGVSSIRLRAKSLIEEGFLRGIAGVKDVAQDSDGWRLKTANIAQTVSELTTALQAVGNEMIDLHVQEPSLEDVFVEFTGDGQSRYNPNL